MGLVSEGPHCRSLAAHEASPQELLDFRRTAFGDDIWGPVDQLCWHIVARDPQTGELAAYYRALNWRDLSEQALQQVSPVLKVFQPRRPLSNGNILELGRLCTSPTASWSVINTLWSEVAALTERLGAAKCVGMATAPPELREEATLVFQEARRLAEDPELRMYEPRASLVHVNEAGRLDEETRPVPAPRGVWRHSFSRLIRAYFMAGARFGPDALWADFGGRPCILTSIARDDYARRRSVRQITPAGLSEAPLAP